MGLMQEEYRSFDSREPEPNPYWQQSRTRSRAQAEPQSATDGTSAREGNAFLIQINQSLARLANDGSDCSTSLDSQQAF
jgi:hypothetical protein